MIWPVFAGLALAALTGWIVLPLTGRKPAPADPRNAAADDLLEVKESAYRSILDLELDHKTGKVTGPEYERLRTEYESEALQALRLLDEQDWTMDRLELEIAEARQRLDR